MHTSEIIYLGDLRTKATHYRSKQSIVTDAPVDNQGKGEAFSPTDLLATSLAACMITVLGIYAQKNSIELAVSGKVTKHMANEPRRVQSIDIELIIKSSANAEQKKLMENAALNCPVAKSLHINIKQNVRFKYL